jgi:hypothetical protein
MQEEAAVAALAALAARLALGPRRKSKGRQAGRNEDAHSFRSSFIDWIAVFALVFQLGTTAIT